MTLIRAFIALFILDLFLTAPSFAQNKKGDKEADGRLREKASSQVEIETDRFSGKTTVKLKPQTLIDTPEHKLNMAIQNHDGFLGIRFDSISRDYIIFGNRELWFIVDGKSMRIDVASEARVPFASENRDEQGRRPWTTLISSMSLAQAEAIVSGNEVEMRLGPLELTWSRPILENLREYVRTLASYAPSRRKTGERKPW
ncbi:MAG TPA: hypothetical protein VIM99_17165 [Blastocatellia bacterium]